MNDKKLVKAALKNPDSFGKLVEKYQEKLFRYVKRILFISDADAEDILQNAFISTYKNLNSYNPKYKFSSWVYRITHNSAMTYMRRNRKHIGIYSYTQEEMDRFVSDFDEVGKRDEKMDAEMIKLKIEKLDDKYKAALVLKYFEEKDYNEISDILKIPVGTVGSLISRGRDKLKKLLNEE